MSHIYGTGLLLYAKGEEKLLWSLAARSSGTTTEVSFRPMCDLCSLKLNNAGRLHWVNE